MRITLIVGGSIAAYKAAELVRSLVKAEAKVQVILTPAATEFITPLTMQTLSGRRVFTDQFSLTQESEISHIKAASEADVLVVAPATADLIAKAAAGIADNAATSVMLASKAPLVIAPAMNVNMWTHPATQRNLATLKEFGAYIVEPESGDLACGWQGQGRLASNSDIVDAIEYVLSPKDLVGSRVVVTAGPTREPLDPIRFISNLSSGKMGYSIARAAHLRGAKVVLVSGPTQLQPPEGVEFCRVDTALEMRDRVLSLLRTPAPAGRRSTQFLFMVSAVSDHRPREISTDKLKHDKTKDYELHMTPNPDILQEIGEKRREIEQASGTALKIVGFKAETGKPEQLLRSARQKLESKRCDLIVGNLAHDAFARDTNRVWLVDSHGKEEEIAMTDKQTIAERIVSAAMNT